MLAPEKFHRKQHQRCIKAYVKHPIQLSTIVLSTGDVWQLDGYKFLEKMVFEIVINSFSVHSYFITVIFIHTF